MKKRVILGMALCVSLVVAAACGGGDDDNGDNETPGSSASASASRAARTPAPRGTGTPEAGATGAATPFDPNGPDGLPGTADDIDELDPNVSGGDPGSAPQVVATVPPVTPAPGVTPIVDPTEIAEPEATGALRLVVDLDASRAGIQSTRDVNVGDTIRAAVAIVNAPQRVDDLGGVTAFNFVVTYDKTKIVAPTIAGGPATQRNPAPNIADLGGEAAGWDCLPAPEGDLDDPGGIEGDGNPATGEAFLSCFAPGTGDQGGTIVLGIITFQVIASGSQQLTLSDVSVGDAVGVEFATCEGATGASPVACEGATLNVR